MSLKRLLGAVLVIIFSLGMAIPSIADVRVGPWNIQNLGWNNGKNYDALAEVARHFDLLTVQEAMNADSIERLKRKLEASTGGVGSSLQPPDWPRQLSGEICIRVAQE